MLFRTIAVLLAPILLVLLEAALRLAGVSPAPYSEDPFVSFSETPILFVPDDSGCVYRTAEERLAFFHPQSFPVHKSPGAFRVFVLGGSTVQGRPYAVETSFTTWLQLNLQAAQPQRQFEVINCGGVSYASYRLLPIMRETLQYAPDLFIVYTGHNEFLEDRTYGDLKDASPFQTTLRCLALNLRVVSLARRALSQPDDSSARPCPAKILPAEVDARLDYENGLEGYHRDPVRRKGIIRSFEYNMSQMILLAREAGVPIILVNPVSNLKDCPPFKSEFSSTLSPQEKAELISLWQQADALNWDEAGAKALLLERAAKIDSHHAGLLYTIGKVYERLGRTQEATTWLLAAKEEDICPLRILEPMHESLFRLSKEFSVPLVDVRSFFEDRTLDGIPGNELLLDHVHPSIEGHQLIADALFEQMLAMNLVRTSDGWQATHDLLRKRHLESLDAIYFARGAARMQRLESWSRGRIPLRGLKHREPSQPATRPD
jgi:lysophospholipase L1-like esterase